MKAFYDLVNAGEIEGIVDVDDTEDEDEPEAAEQIIDKVLSPKDKKVLEAYLKRKVKTESSYMGNVGDKVKIVMRSKGEYVLVSLDGRKLIDMTFDSESEAKKYADKKRLVIVETEQPSSLGSSELPAGVKNVLEQEVESIITANAGESLPTLWTVLNQYINDFVRLNGYSFPAVAEYVNQILSQKGLDTDYSETEDAPKAEAIQYVKMVRSFYQGKANSLLE
jgi:hypothetical protein